MNEGGLDAGTVLGDGVGQLDEGRQPAATSSHQPVVEESQGAPWLVEMEDLTVKSARGAVPASRPARFPGPLPEPGMRVAPHPALHESQRTIHPIRPCPSTARESGCHGSGSAQRAPRRG